MSDQIEVVRAAFRAVEKRDEAELLELYDDEVELHEAPSLPYGGAVRGKRALEARPLHKTWSGVWDPLQPTEAERRMDPRIVAASEDEVVVLWRQRGLSPSGERFDGPVLAVYVVRASKLCRLQMFHFDTAAVVGFLERARSRPSQ